MKETLRSYEEAHKELCTLEPSEDQFYGFSKGASKLSKYIQWVYVPAVKDATKEGTETKNTALSKLLTRTVRSKVKFDEAIKTLRDRTVSEYQDIVTKQQGALDEISQTLTSRLAEWAHPAATANLVWANGDNNIKVDEPIAKLLAGEGDFEGDLARFGHGLQRSYLLALLQELAACNNTNSPRLILGCEEPELYQHPPQARHLSSVLQTLAEGEGNAQIIVTTHSPYFVSGQNFESVRMVRRDQAARNSDVTQVTFESLAKRLEEVNGKPLLHIPATQAKLEQALRSNLNEMFFTSNLILVEGIEDVAYITSWLILSNRWDSFRRYGCHIVQVNGKDKMILPLLIANELSIPTFIVFDADGNKKGTGERKHHEDDNKALLKISGEMPLPFPDEVIWGKNCVVWPTNIGDVLKGKFGKHEWDTTFGQVRNDLEIPEGESYTKNTFHIARHLEIIKKDYNDLEPLTRLCVEILRFARESSGRATEIIPDETAAVA